MTVTEGSAGAEVQGKGEATYWGASEILIKYFGVSTVFWRAIGGV